MISDLFDELSNIHTIDDMYHAFQDEEHCRYLMENLVWPTGRICPCCGFRRSIMICGRDMGKKRARPGLYQCSNSSCRFQFTVTTHTPLHSTKLPLSLWLKGMWLILQSDKGISSVRLGEILGISQQSAWRMGHAIRLLAAGAHMLDGTVELDQFYLGGRQRKPPDQPPSGRGRKGEPRTTKKPVTLLVQRSSSLEKGSLSGQVRAEVVDDLSIKSSELFLTDNLSQETNLMSDDWGAFKTVGNYCSSHETVNHSQKEYVRGTVHVNGAEGFNARVKQTVSGVFHHISPQHANLYFHEMAFRWSQRTVEKTMFRKTKSGRQTRRTLWTRIAPAMQIKNILKYAIGRQFRRTSKGSISIKSKIAVFGW